MAKTLKHGYNFYISNGGTLEYNLFRAVCSDFNMMVMDEILLGNIFLLGSGLATLSIVRVPTNFRKPKVNWLESNKRRKELEKEGIPLYSKDNPDGKKWYVYYLKNEYCRFYWNRFSCIVPNKTVYIFSPTTGTKGNKRKLVDLLKKDDTAYLRFRKLNRSEEYIL